MEGGGKCGLNYLEIKAPFFSFLFLIYFLRTTRVPQPTCVSFPSALRTKEMVHGLRGLRCGGAQRPLHSKGRAQEGGGAPTHRDATGGTKDRSQLSGPSGLPQFLDRSEEKHACRFSST